MKLFLPLLFRILLAFVDMSNLDRLRLSIILRNRAKTYKWANFIHRCIVFARHHGKLSKAQSRSIARICSNG